VPRRSRRRRLTAATSSPPARRAPGHGTAGVTGAYSMCWPPAKAPRAARWRHRWTPDPARRGRPINPEITTIGLAQPAFKRRDRRRRRRWLARFHGRPARPRPAHVMLPRLDGLEVARESAAMATTPISCSPTAPTRSDIVAASSRARTNYVRSPSRWPELVARVRAALRGGWPRPASPHSAGFAAHRPRRPDRGPRRGGDRPHPHGVDLLLELARRRPGVHREVLLDASGATTTSAIRGSSTSPSGACGPR